MPGVSDSEEKARANAQKAKKDGILSNLQKSGTHETLLVRELPLLSVDPPFVDPPAARHSVNNSEIPLAVATAMVGKEIGWSFVDRQEVSLELTVVVQW